jgi:hypothetical protein
LVCWQLQDPTVADVDAAGVDEAGERQHRLGARPDSTMLS